MKKLLPIITFFLLLNITGCHKERVNSDLLVAESVMESKPDSAYRILKNIDSAILSSDINKAKYCLLMTQAMVKNDVPFDSDSLISFAVDYYTDHPTDSDLMKSLFYKGEYIYNHGNLEKSTECALRSRKIAINLNNSYWRGKSAKLLSDILTISLLSSDALQMDLEAAEHFKKAGKDNFYIYTMANLATDYSNLGQQEKALNLIDSVLSIAKASNDTSLIVYCNRILYPILEEFERYDEAWQILTELKNSDNPIAFETEEEHHYVNFEIKRGNFEAAKSRLDNLRKTASCSRDSAYVFYNYRRYYKVLGDYKKALEYTDSTYDLNFVALSKVTKQSPKEVKTRFYSHIAEKERKRSENLKIYIIIISLIFLLLMAIVVIIHTIRMKKKDSIISEKVNELLVMSHELHNKKEEKEDHSEQERNLRAEIERLYKGKWEFLNIILNEYLKNADDRKFADNFVLRVNECISRIKTEENLSQIEESVNRYMDDCISVLRRNCPDFTESDLQFVALYISGFSRNAICIMLDLKIKSFYSRKGRIQEKIARYDFPEKDFIMKQFGD